MVDASQGRQGSTDACRKEMKNGQCVLPGDSLHVLVSKLFELMLLVTNGTAGLGSAGSLFRQCLWLR